MTSAERTTFVAIAVLTTLGAAGPRAATLEGPQMVRRADALDPPRVRTDDPELKQVISQATEWSATFRRLVEMIQRTDGIVFVQKGHCGHGVRSCLLLSVAVAGPNRLLRIFLDPRKSGEDLVPSLGHELQHAIEMLRNPAVVDAKSMYQFLHRTAVTLGGPTFETLAAIEAGMAVKGEIARYRSQRAGEAGNGTGQRGR